MENKKIAMTFLIWHTLNMKKLTRAFNIFTMSMKELIRMFIVYRLFSVWLIIAITLGFINWLIPVFSFISLVVYVFNADGFWQEGYCNLCKRVTHSDTILDSLLSKEVCKECHKN